MLNRVARVASKPVVEPYEYSQQKSPPKVSCFVGDPGGIAHDCTSARNKFLCSGLPTVPAARVPFCKNDQQKSPPKVSCFVGELRVPVLELFIPRSN